MRVHHALRAARCPARVVDADGVVLGLESIFWFAGPGGREELLVGAVRTGDEQTFDMEVGDQVCERRVDDDDSRSRMADDVRDLVRGQARVDRDQHCAGRRNAEVRFE